MRNFVLAITCSVLCTAPALADTFHVSVSGSDGNPGTADAPFATIAHAVAGAGPGDSVIVYAGIYRETVRPPISGTADAPVVIRVAKDESVVVSGTEPLAGWVRVAEGHWKVPCEESARQVFLDGEMLPEACWPNTPRDPMRRAWADAAKGTEPGRIVHPDLPVAGLEGAAIHVLPGANWVSWTREVTGHDPEAGDVRFAADWDQSPPYEVRPGTRFFLFGARGLLDAPDEWWHDAETGELHLLLPAGMDPNGRAIEVKRRNLAFDLRGLRHVQVRGFHVTGATISMEEAQDCLVEDCHLRYASHFTDALAWAPRNDSGLVIGGSGNTVRRCSVQYSAGNGVTLLGERNTLENCLVRYTNYNATDCAAVWAEGRGNAIRRCTLSHSGRSVVIHRTMKAGRIEYNDMHHGGLMTGDLGITYCFNTDGEGTVIARNWVHDNVSLHTGVGIYIDNDSSNFVIHHNVSWNNNDSGIRLNTASTNNKVYNNTVLNNGNSLGYWGPDGLDDQPDCEAANNIFTDAVAVGEGMHAHHNYEGEEPRLLDPENRDFRPAAGSPVIDAGTQIPGITDGFEGAAPDIGAYEHGAPRWTAGHDWGEPPVF